MKNLLKFGALTMAITAGSAVSASAEKFIAAHGFVPTHTAVKNGVDPWMACVTEATAGEVTFDHFPSGEISGHKESMASLTNGLADLSMVVPGYETGRLPLSNMSMLPGFGATATEMDIAYRKMLENGSPMLDEWTAQGVMPIMNVQTPAYQLLGMTEPMTTIEAFKGKLIRAGGGTANLAVASVEGVPVEMASPDMFLALQRGTVDATILSLTSAPAYGLPDILKSVSNNGSFGSGQSVLTMNKERFDALSDAHRAAFLDCGRKMEISGGEAADRDNEALKTEFASKGIAMYDFPPETLEQINERLATVAEDYVVKLEQAGSTTARPTYEAYLEALGK